MFSVSTLSIPKEKDSKKDSDVFLIARLFFT